MTKTLPACTKCSMPLQAEFVNAEELQPCPRCESPLRVELFPAFFRETPRGRAGEALLADTEASCFYHPNKRASVVCSGCGRFLCALCDLELEGAHYCTACLEAATTAKKIKSLENRRTLYDVIVLCAGLLFFLPFMAPTAIYLTIKHWKTPLSIVRKPSRLCFVVGFTLAVLQVLGWLTLLGLFLTR
jgi:hypothetical protein